MALGRAQIELARALDRRPAGRVALELLNEPACKRMKGVEWPTVQASLYGVVRQASPTLPLVLTGCNGLPDDLVRLDVSRYRDDPNAIFTFHFYEPFIFTHQTTYYGGVAFRQVPFPPQPETFGMVGAVAAHMTVGTAAQNLGAANDLIIYLKSRQDNSFVAGRFREMATWADRNGIPRNRIYVGEFGTSTRLRDDDAKAIWPDMLDWLRTVSSAAASQHFAYSLWPPARPGLIFSDPETGFYRRDVLAAIGLAR
jgi:hypothetical protein